jgi:hypothetical protein
MGKKGDIRVGAEERHKIPNSEVRGYLNQLKKEEKQKDSRSLEILNAQIATSSDAFGSLVLSSIIGLIVTHYYPNFNSGIYWVGLFLTTGFINSFKLNRKKVLRDDYIPSWKKER